MTSAFAPLSDVDGRIAHVFFALPAHDRSLTAPLLETFRGIRDALEFDVRCTVLHHAIDETVVREVLAAPGPHPLDTIAWNEGFVLRLRDAESSVEGSTLRIARLGWPDYTNWVQDAFIVACQPSGLRRVWASPRVKRHHGGWDDAVPPRLAAHLGWDCEALPSGVEIGNVLVDQQSVVVGADVPSTLGDAQWTSLRSWLEAGGRRVVVPAPDSPQPIFHLDLYVTLAGGRQPDGRPLALVGSVRRARQIIGEACTEADIATDAALDEVADDLVTAGYAVERLPLLPLRDAHAAPSRHDVWYSHNNCLVEVWRGSDVRVRRRVTLPAYASQESERLGALDVEAAHVWSSVGFDVTLTHGSFARLVRLGGSIRCMTKVLERSHGVVDAAEPLGMSAGASVASATCDAPSERSAPPTPRR